MGGEMDFTQVIPQMRHSLSYHLVLHVVPVQGLKVMHSMLERVIAYTHGIVVAI